MKQLLLRMALPAQSKLFPDQFREAMARRVGEVPGLFHYEENGRTAQGRPAVRFLGGKNWVGIVADEAASDLLYGQVGAAIETVTEHCGRPVSVNVEEHEVSLALRDAPRQYRITRMALKRRTDPARNKPIEELVKERLLSSIEAQALRFGFDCPVRSELDMHLSIGQQFGMPLRTTTGTTKEYITVVSAEFTTHLHLGGFWFGGNLTARGHGRITAHRPQVRSAHA